MPLAGNQIGTGLRMPKCKTNYPLCWDERLGFRQLLQEMRGLV